MADLDLLASYDYELPAELIADVPLPRRDASRLMTVDWRTGAIGLDGMKHFPMLLRSGDVLVLNETRVIPAQLRGFRTATGGKWQGLFLGTDENARWRLIGQTRGSLQPGESVMLLAPADRAAAGEAAETLELVLLERLPQGEWLAEPRGAGSPLELLDRFGHVPLPPYVPRVQAHPDDRERYQTVYARTPGAIAAPTAGLHFTPELLSACRARGVELAWVTLHVGIGTFRPVTAARLKEHVMHGEWCAVPDETADAILRAREAGGRVVAVGTTTVRTLEAVAASGPLRGWSGETNLFIRPPFEFQVVDALLTNFHLPRSTLLILLCAFAGRDVMLAAYARAVQERFRFFSYGDAMFVS